MVPEKWFFLIENYIRNNQNMFENHADVDFNNYWDKMELDKTWGTYTKLLAFSTMLEIDIDAYDNIQWVKSLISIKRTQTKENFHFYIQNGLITICFIF